MQHPLRVADRLVQLLLMTSAENHLAGPQDQEGRTLAQRCISIFPHRAHPWTRPLPAKPASSQGGALATEKRVHNPKLNRTEDMIMESLHD
jgi:hypothetical protein